MSAYVNIRAGSRYDSKDILDVALFRARVGAPGKDYTVTSLGEGTYKIEFNRVPPNFLETVGQRGEIRESNLT